ncbi:hypothetical protein ABV409_01825 [Flagellimonas sp. DF-77]
MANESSMGMGMLEGFLRLMIFALVAILIAIPVCVVLDLLGIF